MNMRADSTYKCPCMRKLNMFKCAGHLMLSHTGYLDQNEKYSSNLAKS